jgi:hypothetical protein
VHFAARPHQRLPVVSIELAGEEDFNPSGQMLRSCCARWWLRVHASSPPEQAGGDDARVIEDEEFVTAEEIGELREQPVFENPGGTIQAQEPRCIATRKGMLRNLPARETVVEFVQTHGNGQFNSKVAKAKKANVRSLKLRSAPVPHWVLESFWSSHSFCNLLKYNGFHTSKCVASCA